MKATKDQSHPVKVRLIIKKKVGVFDPEAKVIESALANLDYKVENTTMKKVIELTIFLTKEEKVEKKIASMCQTILVNPVLETYAFEILT